MKPVLDHTKPWQRHFEEMTQIPHGSYNEKAYSDHVAAFARAHNFRFKQYDNGDIIVYKPASAGYEDHPSVALQAHSDMVCEKTPDSTHNFETDPLDLYIEDGYLHARGTTLGADDGTGCAYMLAVLEDDTLKHPALECIFTVSEETGLEGAMVLCPEDVQSRRLIGLDDGSGGKHTTVSSAGGSVAWISFDAPREPADAPGYLLNVGGLLGGHSGGCIHLERGNALKIAARLLDAVSEKDAIRLASLNGGSKDNAIPRDCEVAFTCLAPEDEIRATLEACAAQIRAEARNNGDDLHITLTCADAPHPLTQSASDAVLRFVRLCPNGKQHGSTEIEGLTAASQNLAKAATEEGIIRFDVSMRGASASFISELERKNALLAEAFGASITFANRYPAWPFVAESPLRALYRDMIKELTGMECAIRATHGGLECGIFADKWPGIDIVTMGPIAEDIHSPTERLDLQSFDDCYAMLTALLARL